MCRPGSSMRLALPITAPLENPSSAPIRAPDTCSAQRRRSEASCAGVQRFHSCVPAVPAAGSTGVSSSITQAAAATGSRRCLRCAASSRRTARSLRQRQCTGSCAERVFYSDRGTGGCFEIRDANEAGSVTLPFSTVRGAVGAIPAPAAVAFSNE